MGLEAKRCYKELKKEGKLQQTACFSFSYFTNYFPLG